MNYRETYVKVEDKTLYIFHSTPKPFKPIWHKLIAAYTIKIYFGDYLIISFKDCFSMINGKQSKVFKKKRGSK